MSGFQTFSAQLYSYHIPNICLETMKYYERELGYLVLANKVEINIVDEMQIKRKLESKFDLTL